MKFIRYALAIAIGVNQAYASGESVVAVNNIAVVQTESGKVQGYIHHDILTYKGIPYARAKRFMPPEKVAPWQGEKLAITYGDVCPQVAIGGRSFFFVGPEIHESEQCQNLNIWTPSVSGSIMTKNSNVYSPRILTFNLKENI